MSQGCFWFAIPVGHREGAVGSPWTLPCALQVVLRGQLCALLFSHGPANTSSFTFAHGLSVQWLLEAILILTLQPGRISQCSHSLGFPQSTPEALFANMLN